MERTCIHHAVVLARRFRERGHQLSEAARRLLVRLEEAQPKLERLLEEHVKGQVPDE